MTREETIVSEVAWDLMTLTPELREPYWQSVTTAYFRGLQREGHPYAVIAENYDAFSAAVASQLSRLCASGQTGNA